MSDNSSSTLAGRRSCQPRRRPRNADAEHPASRTVQRRLAARRPPVGVLRSPPWISPLYRRVRWSIKLLLWWVFVALTGYCALNFAENLLWTVTTDRTLYYIGQGPSFEAWPPFVAGLVAAPVQALLVARTASLLRSRKTRYTFVGFTSILILFTLTCACLVTGTDLLYFQDAIDRVYPLSWNSTIAMWLCGTAAVDVTVSIALAMTFKSRAAGFIEQTDSFLYKLIQSALQTALYTSVFAVLGAVTALAFKDFDDYASVPYAFWAPLPPRYGISLYTTLSTRRTVEEYIGTSIPLPGAAQHGLSPSPLTSKTGVRPSSPQGGAGRTGRMEHLYAGPIGPVSSARLVKSWSGGKREEDEEGEEV